jgi:heme-degrading monooxygenase HmoA
MIVKTPAPPYYAVIFTSTLKEQPQGYAETAREMEALANDQPGYLGMESARSGLGISVSYWKDIESIQNWKNNVQHALAKDEGKKNWYASYRTRIARVEKEY